jgi:hypothetical protein
LGREDECGGVADGSGRMGRTVMYYGPFYGFFVFCSWLLVCAARQRRDDECSAKVLGLARRQHAPAYLAVAATGVCAAPCSYLLALYALALRGCSVSRSRDSVSHSHPWLATRPPWSFVLSGRSDDRAQRSVAEKLSPAPPPFHQCVVIERNLSLTQIFVIFIFFISTLIICSIEKLKL